MDIMSIFNQAISVIFNPRASLEKSRNQKTEMMDAIFYLTIVGIPTLIGLIIGYGIIWQHSLGRAVISGVVYYILAIIGIVVFSYIFNILSPTFKSTQNQMNALKLVTIAATPWLIAGIFYIYPPLGILVFLAGIYGLYILYKGIPILMGTPKDQQIPYLIIAVVIYFVITIIIWSISVSIISWGVYGPRFF